MALPPLVPVDQAKHQVCLLRSAIKHYGEAFPNLCARCAIDHQLECGALCPCFVTRNSSLIRGVKFAEKYFTRRLQRKSWFEGGASAPEGAVNVAKNRVLAAIEDRPPTI